MKGREWSREGREVSGGERVVAGREGSEEMLGMMVRE